jgi:anti-sigma factor RsiW
MAQCFDEDVQLVHVYLDGELDVATALSVERKIAADPALRKLAGEISALKKALAESFPRQPLSPGLQARIDAAIGFKKARPFPRWLLIAASVLVAIALSSTLTTIALHEVSPDDAGSELVDGHLRSLMAAKMTDVVSSDRHTVKPWFNGRTTQAPRVVDLDGQDFELVGGRVDVVGRKPVPTLVYRKRQHVISLTEIVGQHRASSSFDRRAENGFNIIQWNDSERSYTAISDLNAVELEAFATSFRDASR